MSDIEVIKIMYDDIVQTLFDDIKPKNFVPAFNLASAEAIG